LLLLSQTHCFLTAESEKVEQPKNVPIYSPSQATKLPQKAKGKAIAYSAPSERNDKRDGLSVFDVFRCDEDNNELCRDKLEELGLYYCHCYEDADGNIVRCGYRGKRNKCKTPVFN